MQYYQSYNHHAPQGYWDSIRKERRKHKLVGRAAWIGSEFDVYPPQVYECVEAEDDFVILHDADNRELIICGYDNVAKIKWRK